MRDMRALENALPQRTDMRLLQADGVQTVRAGGGHIAIQNFPGAIAPAPARADPAIQAMQPARGPHQIVELTIGQEMPHEGIASGGLHEPEVPGIHLDLADRPGTLVRELLRRVLDGPPEVLHVRVNIIDEFSPAGLWA